MVPTGRWFSKLLLIALIAGTSRVARTCPATVSFSSRGETAEELLVKLFKRSGDSFLIEPGPRRESRISVSLVGAPLEIALKRICESVDMTWTKQDRVYIISPNRKSKFSFAAPAGLYSYTHGPSGNRMHLSSLLASPRLNLPVLPGLTDSDMARLILATPGMSQLPALPLRGTLTFDDGNRLFSARAATEERSTFACPHCRKSVTIVSRNNTCAKCARSIQRDWAFCPFDGAKRTTPLEEWRACPFCARGVR